MTDEGREQPTIELVDLPDDYEVPDQYIFNPKWYLMGFPKAGTHLLTALFRPYARHMPAQQLHKREWVGTFDHNSWSDEWLDLRQTMYHFGHLRPGHYFKGHCGWTQELETFLWNLGIAFVFIYRDLRDVAVSQVHHCRDDKEAWTHPDKELYRAMSYDEALAAVINGVDRFAGLLERWELYAPWLKVDWVHQVRYEQALEDPVNVAKGIVRYGINRLVNIFGWRIQAPLDAEDELAQEMAASMRDTDKSPTFRRGVAGGWREVFTAEHKRLFKEADTNNWLIRLGYERDRDW